MFSCEFCKISKNSFFTEDLWATASENWKELPLITEIYFRIRHTLAKTQTAFWIAIFHDKLTLSGKTNYLHIEK